MREQDFQKPFPSLAALVRSPFPLLQSFRNTHANPYYSFWLKKHQKGMGGEEEASWLSSLIDQADNLILTIGGYDIDSAGEKRFLDWHGLAYRH